MGRVDGKREFDSQTILTLRFLKLAHGAGFTLRESRMLLEMGFGEARKQDRWEDFLRVKRAELKARVAEIEDMTAVLERFQRCDCPTLAECLTDPRAP